MAVVKTLIGYIKGPKGDQGEQGVQGVAGSDGTSATISVGTVTTAASGTPARVTNSGTTRDAVFDFVIPQGQPGSVGEIATYAVNQITSASQTFPKPEVGDTIATVTGKQAKAVQDTQDAILQVLGDMATVEASNTASKSFAAGEYLVLDGKLYVTKAAITAGASFVIGGNIDQTTVGDAMTSLKSDFSNISDEVSTNFSKQPHLVASEYMQQVGSRTFQLQVNRAYLIITIGWVPDSVNSTGMATISMGATASVVGVIKESTATLTLNHANKTATLTTTLKYTSVFIYELG